MAEKLIFRGAAIRHFDVRQSQDGAACYCRIHMSVSFTEQQDLPMATEEQRQSVLGND